MGSSERPSLSTTSFSACLAVVIQLCAMMGFKSKRTKYEPGTTLVNKYAPAASVVVVATRLELRSSNCTVMLPIPVVSVAF
ncbi:MAG: hypothetical protein BWX54_02440 [Verrucomicrobia bacterium ADurb.Bin018]|nr:MAG: hypothetical protein BWX54_02440 [Verrucomicrobia bacterium ADurb.Bin018]